MKWIWYYQWNCSQYQGCIVCWEHQGCGVQPLSSWQICFVSCSSIVYSTPIQDCATIQRSLGHGWKRGIPDQDLSQWLYHESSLHCQSDLGFDRSDIGLSHLRIRPPNNLPLDQVLFHSKTEGKFPEWNFVYFISFILRLEWQDEVGMTKNSHSRVILKGMMIERYLTSHPSSRSFEVILTWNDLRMTKYPHSVVIPGWLGMNFRLHEKSPDFRAGPCRVQGMIWNDAGMM